MSENNSTAAEAAMSVDEAVARASSQMDKLAATAEEQILAAARHEAADHDEKLRLECFDRALRYGGSSLDDMPHIVKTHLLIASAREIYDFTQGSPPYDWHAFDEISRLNAQAIDEFKRRKACSEKAPNPASDASSQAPSEPSASSAASAEPSGSAS